MGFVLKSLCTHPNRLALGRVHQLDNSLFHLCCYHKPVFRLVHWQCNFNLLHQNHPVESLLGVEWPSHNRHPSTHRFQHRVPPAMTHKPTHRVVIQHRHLRGPHLDHETAVFSPIQEPIGKQRFQFWIGLTGGVGKFSGKHRPSDIALRALGSRDSNVFTITPADLENCFEFSRKFSYALSFRSRIGFAISEEGIGGTPGIIVVNGGEAKEAGEGGGAGCVEEVAGDAQLGGNGEPESAEEVHDKSFDGEVLGDGEEGLVDVRVSWLGEEAREGGREMVGRWWKMREGMVAETEVMYEAVSSAR
ncbi:unnamed protein product [Malus baccata var. baccata]